MNARNILIFALGVLFALGLGIGGMTQPAKVIGFLDFAGGAWDPSLAFVMAGAVGTYFALYRVVTRRSSPLLAPKFCVPTSRTIDAKLVGGAALFGIGWGLAGYCPGPAITSAGAGSSPALVLTASMLAGIALHELVIWQRKRPAAGPSTKADCTPSM